MSNIYIIQSDSSYNIGDFQSNLPYNNFELKLNYTHIVRYLSNVIKYIYFFFLQFACGLNSWEAKQATVVTQVDSTLCLRVSECIMNYQLILFYII